MSDTPPARPPLRTHPQVVSVVSDRPQEGPRKRSFWDVVFGRRLASTEEDEQKIGPLAGVAVLGLDALSSAAYGPEAALTLLIPLGALGLARVVPITGIIIAVLLIVYFSYRQTIGAYPNGGGSYTVAKENLGQGWALLAGAALALDYILNVRRPRGPDRSRGSLDPHARLRERVHRDDRGRSGQQRCAALQATDDPARGAGAHDHHRHPGRPPRRDRVPLLGLRHRRHGPRLGRVPEHPLAAHGGCPGQGRALLRDDGIGGRRARAVGEHELRRLPATLPRDRARPVSPRHVRDPWPPAHLLVRRHRSQPPLRGAPRRLRRRHRSSHPALRDRRVPRVHPLAGGDGAALATPWGTAGATLPVDQRSGGRRHGCDAGGRRRVEVRGGRVTRWYHAFLHNNRGAVLRALLRLRGGPRVVVVNVPFYVDE